MTSVKNELIGTWELLSYIEVPIDGSETIFPMGQNPTGILIYGADNYMSLQIAANPRTPYSTNDRINAPEDEVIKSMMTYVAYAGMYYINNQSGIVSYSIATSLFPNWEKEVISRKASFESDILFLNSIEPILVNNILVNSYLTWKKIERSSSLHNQAHRSSEKVNISNHL